VLASLICRVFGHRVDRHRVWNDGVDFRTSCARCGRALLRAHVGWREFDTERDSDQNREPHPKHDKG
jgi:hypothetical protein